MINTDLKFIPNTPKINVREAQGKDGFYHFYPGYSTEFVKDILQYWDLPKDSVILDPWNGSGTTTEAAKDLGYHAKGYDLNPVMIIIAKARNVSASQYQVLKEMQRDFEEKLQAFEQSPKLSLINDPLKDWFVPETVEVIRVIEYCIQSISLDFTENVRLFQHLEKLLKITPETAFFYVALFRVLKEFSSSFRSSNPTWIKKPRQDNDRAFFSEESVISCFNDQVNELLALLSNEVNDLKVETGSISLGLSNSTNLIVENESVDAVITSPPYCTRIDYAVLTSLELALLGINDDDLVTLRRTLIGSPLTHPTEPKINVNWGNLCLTTINRIKQHDSKASNTYYLRTYLQYFDGLYKSLIEIDRVLTSNGKCVIVVQDSYYKDIHIDLAEIVSEMVASLNWKHTKQFSYTSKQSMSWINTNSKKYRNITKDKETVLFFHKRS